MASRCICGYDGDPTAFGECRTCFPEAPIPQPAEHRYEQTLSPDELEN